jgi:ribosome modulation factor
VGGLPFGAAQAACCRVRKRRILGGLLGAMLLVGVVLPIGYIEIGCRSTANVANVAPRPILSAAADQRPESRTFLTYPEWHIVYSAENYARHLQHAPPSSYGYWRDVRSFWTSTCAMNRAADPAAIGDTKVMLYTIGVSFGVELMAKALYENTLGRISEWVGGWHSLDDRYAAGVQTSYGAIMHETPWYRFPFGRALSELWGINSGGARHWERRFALSGEYGVKAGYAALIGWASGATLGADEVRMRAVVDADAAQLRVLVPEARVVRSLPSGRSIVDVPRYARFTTLATRLAWRGIGWREIAGNDRIMLTYLAPRAHSVPGLPAPLFRVAAPITQLPTLERRAVLVPVTQLSVVIRQIGTANATLEHVYDY